MALASSAWFWDLTQRSLTRAQGSRKLFRRCTKHASSKAHGSSSLASLTSRSRPSLYRHRPFVGASTAANEVNKLDEHMCKQPCMKVKHMPYFKSSKTSRVLINDCEQSSIVQHIATMGLFIACLGGASPAA